MLNILATHKGPDQPVHTHSPSLQSLHCSQIQSMDIDDSSSCRKLYFQFNRIGQDGCLKNCFTKMRLIPLSEQTASILFNWHLLSSADNLCKQFGPRSGLT